ncbi:MAG: TIGR01777 family oxidoreductase [Streptosporangiaceae bacterium]
MRIVIGGASGLIGTALAASLEQDGHEVTRLVRRVPSAPGQVRWTPGRALDPAVLSGSDGVVNLSGAPVAAGRWTTARKQVLRDSRVGATTTLAAAIAAAPAPPPVLLSGSAIGWYGETGDREVDETAPAASGFLSGLVSEWEAAAAPASAAGTRVVTLRSGVVLAGGGGMLRPLAPLFKLGLGARLGSGGQYLSWIALADHVRAARFLLEHDIDGPVNLTAPAPVTNAAFTAALGRAVHRPAVFAVPAPALRAALGEVSTELLGSVRVRPARLLAAGFTFQYPSIDAALAAAVG